jgi:hypothetical protein
MFTWLWEKSRVRQTADRANGALDHQERAIKAKWDEECKGAYRTLSGEKLVASTQQEPQQPPVEAEKLS